MGTVWVCLVGGGCCRSRCCCLLDRRALPLIIFNAHAVIAVIAIDTDLAFLFTAVSTIKVALLVIVFIIAKGVTYTNQF